MQIINKFQISNFKFQVSSSRGIALVAVLAILTVLAILAASFTVFSKMESDTATNITRGMEANSLAESGVEHVKTLLWFDSLNFKNPGDSYKDIWSASFTGKLQKKSPEVDVNLISKKGSKKDGKDAVWIPVHNIKNELIGRYAVVVEDECSKINLNVASMVPPLKPNEGLSTRELYLSDGKSRGVPINRKAAIKILKEKYGPNRVPGNAGDDNENNNVCMGDGLDNDSDGLIDELDEGINELEEYVSHHPFGDDKSFHFLSEIGKIISPEGKISTKQLATLRHYASLNSKDESLRWDKPTRSWKKKSSLNVGDTRDMFKQLKTANEKYLFEQDSKKLRALAANLVDYRDENHVLSTMSSEYGVEAICFNEILANEGSKNISVSHMDPRYIEDKEDRVHCLAFNYSFRDYRWSQPNDLSDSDGVNSTNIAERELYNRYWGFAPYYNEPNLPVYYPAKKRMKLQIAAQPRRKPGGFRCDEKNEYNTEGVFTDFKDLLNNRGSRYIKGNGDYAKVLWPDDIWKGSYLVAIENKGKENEDDYYKSGWENRNVNTKFPKKAFYISENDEEWLYLEDVTSADYQKFLDGIYSTVQLRSWTYDKSYYAEFPEMSTWFVFQKLRPNTYYKTYIIESSLDLPNLYPNQGPTKGHKRMAVKLDVDGNVRSYRSQKIKNMKYKYKDGKAMKSDKTGCMDIFLTSSKKCEPEARNRVSTVSFMRPDIIELINISSRPISLSGWSLVANTGTLAYDIGKINNAIYYERKGRGKFDDKAPVIKPNEYFYICNNKEIFDLEYGSPKNGTYGATASEQMPLHEMDDETSWGIKFLIKKVQYIESNYGQQKNKTIITCGNENWKPNLFRGETAEFQTKKKYKNPKNGDNANPNGIRKTITSNTKDSLIFDTINLGEGRGSGVKPGDYVMIVGLPRVGGFVSLTLKNEYDQVAGRLIQYGDPKKDVKRGDNWEKYINWSVEKYDPTHFTWVENKKPTFGGTVLKARNKCLPKGKNVAMAHIKNGSFASVGEIKNVRKKEDWENIGDAKNRGDTIKTIQAVADFFTSSGMRLDAEDADAHLSGWKPAFGKSAFADTKGLTDINASWKKDMWKDQTLSILSGKNRGESFSVSGNNKNRLNVAGLSVPGRKKFYVGSDCEYSVGPGFSSSSYYCYENPEPAEWEWKNKRIPKSNYKLYIAGLNDGIRTSEFLEENHNARLNISLFNYKKKKYDVIADRKKYGKNDMLFAGDVLPEHISDSGGIKLKIIPSDLSGKYSSGFAWFDYAYITPLPVYGRVNINTASKRVLMALNKVDKKLANNIFLGKNTSGKNILKPYNSISDILYVKGITPDIFAGIANLITARSDQFNVYVLAERIKDVNKDGKFEKNIDKILAVRKLRTLIDRSALTLKKSGKNDTIEVIQTETF